MNLVYLIGEPGIGKSTLMKVLTDGLVRVPQTGRVFHDRLVHPDRCVLAGVEIGRRRQQFSGTDALPLNVMPHACAWIDSQPAELVLAEGDRLASMRFFTAASTAGYAVTVLALLADPPIGEQRRVARKSHQSATWIAGRRTKTLNLALRVANDGHQLVQLDAERNPLDLMLAARAAAPCLKELR